MTGPTLAVSLTRRVNLGNYESADVFMSVSGIQIEMNEDKIAELIEQQGEMAYRQLAAALNKRIKDLRDTSQGNK